MTPHNRAWMRRIWAHQQAQKTDTKLVEVPLTIALRATFSLAFNLWATKLPDGVFGCDLPEAAWADGGTYWSDYGTGYAWETLAVVGLRVYSFEDGSL